MRKNTGLSLLWDADKLEVMKDDPVPSLTDEERQGLLEDIKKNGIEEPLQVIETSDKRYIVVDGRHRFGIAQELGVKKVPILLTLEEDIELHGQTIDEYIRMKCIRLNIYRRHLSLDVKIKLIASLLEKRTGSSEPVYSGKGGRGKKGYVLDGKAVSIPEAAHELGISERTIKTAKKYKQITEKHPDLDGLPVTEALREAKKRERGYSESDAKKEMHKTRLRDTCNVCMKCEQFPCEYIDTLIVNILTSGCGRVGGMRGATKTNIQELIEYYKGVTGIQADDKGWDKAMFGKLTVPAKTILSICNNNIETAKAVIENGRKFFERKGWKWTLFTIAKPNVLMIAHKGATNGKGKTVGYKTDVQLGKRK